ncbi:hypothetical protein BX616_006927 [Lobosporangium transversale]|uniref:Putative gamma-glutamylcyclotransferase n=1 Tax=Lobosporangium transversale TaxID=64571 RepID=A0A1Y2GK09_9FUNG|nr:hypothetical protein BCR41DRAFT_398682 [Lobosporangium transversale]KAF9896700.1 hypothetical protein BX616_006927 [Lobosporangium transversale]ORZ09704.1 hypothetical protein BCR41DRAFT_398682 [Lobosporangium transversale]|eukprot:XP_021878974.1 hypothetical protein BCR41DRAFT_398682 [Lobosporangium transversale]
MSVAIEPYPCFFYGSLMDSRVLNSVTRPGPESNLYSVRATIEGYIRYPYHNEPYPGMIISSDKTNIVHGLLVFGHTMMDRFRLDQFEGSEYSREVLPVKVLDPVPGSFNVIGQFEPLSPGDVISAYVYVFTGSHRNLDQTKEWDFEAFRRDHVTIWMQASSDFAQDQ